MPPNFYHIHLHLHFAWLRCNHIHAFGKSGSSFFFFKFSVLKLNLKSRSIKRFVRSGVGGVAVVGVFGHKMNFVSFEFDLNAFNKIVISYTSLCHIISHTKSKSMCVYALYCNFGLYEQ